jgi:hypothetical protein
MGAGLKWWNWKRRKAELADWAAMYIPNRPYEVLYAPGEGSKMSFEERTVWVDPIQGHSIDPTFKDRLPQRWARMLLQTPQHFEYAFSRAAAKHEFAHVLFTEQQPGVHPAVHHLWNMLEDGRIERLMGSQWSTAWTDFLYLGDLVWNTAEVIDGRGDRREWVLRACLLHRWDVLRPAGADTKIVIRDDAERAFWEDQIRPLVEDAWYEPTSAGVYAKAKQILELLGWNQKQDDLFEQFLRAIMDMLGVLAAPMGERGAGDTVVGVTEAQAQDVRKQMGQPNTTTNDKMDDPSLEQPPAMPGWDALTKAVQEEYMIDPGYLEVEMAGPARRLARDLSSRAPEAGVSHHMTGGRFDPRKSIRTQGAVNFRKRNEVGQSSKGLAIALMIDCTGSMDGDFRINEVTGLPHYGMEYLQDESYRMTHARKAAMLMELACEGAEPRIPLAIGIHCGHYRDNAHTRARMDWREPRWFRTFDTPQHSEQTRALIAGLRGDGSQEQYVVGLSHAELLLQKRSESTRVIMYIADGLVSGGAEGRIREKCEDLRAHGIHVVCLFVGDPPADEQRTSLEYMFGGPQHIVDASANPERLPALIDAQMRKYRKL